MEALELLKQRTSCAQLTEPAPSREQLDTLYRVAFRAADHRQLKPVRFLEIAGDGLEKLGELFVAARRADNPDLPPEVEAKAKSLPTRAPMILAAIVTVTPDDKVPEVEQVLSAGASVQNMLNAAYAMGIGMMWRTGDLAFNATVQRGLGLADNEQLVGFLYTGTPRSGFREAPAFDHSNHVKSWP